MQTPPDSDLDAGVHEDTEFKGEDASDSAPEERQLPHIESSRTTAGSSNKERQLVRRQRRSQKNPLAPSSSKDASLLLYKPTAAASRLRIELVDMMVRTQRDDIWFHLIPARIGHSEAVDCAAKAIVKAADLSAQRSTVTQDSCLSSYGRAISVLRENMEKSMSGDDTLLAIALLVTFERMFSWTSAPMRSHMQGIVAIFASQARASNKPPSDLTRALLYTYWAVAFIMPCVMGTPSPMDCPRWLDAEPVMFAAEKMTASWKCVARLRKLSHQHFIRMPRLIMLVKGLQAEYKLEDVETTILLAKQLLDLEDTNAENELLHNVAIQKAEMPALADITPYVMNFSSITEYEAAMHYWATRILLLRLCWRMSGLYPKKYKEHELKPKSEVESSVSRMAANVLMACFWAVGKGEAGHSSCIMDLVAVWGVLTDFDVFATRGPSATRARTVLRECGRHIMETSDLEESEQRLAAAAELFAGGQSSGILAFTFRKPG